MNSLKGMLSSVLVSLIMISNMTVAIATDSILSNYTDNEVNEKESVELDDLNIQLNDLYKEVGEQLNINYMYVKILHMIADGKAIYAETQPNIEIDKTVEGLNGPFDIAGANQKYNLQATWVTCADDSIQRPSKYYLPDAAFSVTAEVVAIMNVRYNADRGNNTAYFNALSNDVKTNILFCEAVLQYTGSTGYVINNFFNIYEKILYDKSDNENVLTANADGTYSFKAQYKEILVDNGIKTQRELDILSIILGFDSKLASSNCTEDISDTIVLPYEPGYTSRENMMIAAMSLTGKVRYVWGGGHGGSGSFHGINPAWKTFFDKYSTNQEDESYGACIKPSLSWCPIHGSTSGGDACIHIDGGVFSTDDYINKRAEIFSLNDDTKQYMKECLSSVDYNFGIETHRLDGLDCSGYASWVYNQVTSGKEFDAATTSFIDQNGIQSLGMEQQLLPGDVFTWTTHIIVIVGKVCDNSNAYVIIEQAPYTVKFGVAYFNGASIEDIDEAKKIASEANKLFGNIDETTINLNVFNMNDCGSYRDCGRLKQPFIDEDIVISDYDKTIKEMSAKEIIQNVVDSMPYSYLTGVEQYSGEIFKINSTEISTNVVVLNEISEEDIVLTSELS